MIYHGLRNIEWDRGLREEDIDQSFKRPNFVYKLRNRSDIIFKPSFEKLQLLQKMREARSEGGRVECGLFETNRTWIPSAIPIKIVL